MANITHFDPFEDLFRGFFVRPVDMMPGTDPTRLAPSMRIDVKETPEAYTVHAELPGVDKNDISIDIDGATVTLSAERKSEKEVKEGERVLRSERTFGKIARSFTLGQEIDEERVLARYTDGVLDLTLPKRTARAGRRIAIE